MDETPIALFPAKTTTITQKGAKEVLLKMKDYSRSNVTVCLTVSCSGSKLKPFVLFKRIKNKYHLLPKKV